MLWASHTNIASSNSRAQALSLNVKGLGNRIHLFNKQFGASYVYIESSKSGG